jgi:hypothetical protein
VPESIVPDLRTAAQVLLAAREYRLAVARDLRQGRGHPDGLRRARKAESNAARVLTAALAAEATEPPPPEPCDACEIESSGNCRAHRSRPVWQQAGAAPDPQGADEPTWTEVAPDRLARVCDRAHASPHAAEVGHRSGFCLACAEIRVALAVGAPDEPTDDDGGQSDG